MNPKQHSTHSTLREKVVEHVFIGEALRVFWRYGVVNVDVLRPEVDAHGYDLVMARGRLVRHIQFKTGTTVRPGDVSASRQLAQKPSGCIIWIRVTDELELGPYFWFGGTPSEPLPSLDEFETPLRPTHNKKGERPARTGHRVVPRNRFEEVAGVEDLLARLLGEFRYEITVHESGSLTDSELARCAAIVAAGGAVTVDCTAELRRASAIAVATCCGTIVGVGAIKANRPPYATKIAKRSGFPISPQTPELGYVSVDSDHQGHELSHRLVSHLLRGRAGALFATTSSERMKSVLKKAGFERRGGDWDGTSGQLSLWVTNERAV